MQHSFFGSGEWWNPFPPCPCRRPPLPAATRWVPAKPLISAFSPLLPLSENIGRMSLLAKFWTSKELQRTSKELQKNFRRTSENFRGTEACHVHPLGDRACSAVCVLYEGCGTFLSHPWRETGGDEYSPSLPVRLQSQPGTELSHSRLPATDLFHKF